MKRLFIILFLLTSKLSATPDIKIDDPRQHPAILMHAFSPLIVVDQYDNTPDRFRLALLHEDYVKAAHILEINGIDTAAKFFASCRAKGVQLFSWYTPVVIKYFQDRENTLRGSKATNILISNDLKFRTDTAPINDLVKSSIWPEVEKRQHGIDQPKPYFNKEEWRKIKNFYKQLGFLDHWILIEALLLNHEMRHLTTYHLDELHFQFFEDLRWHLAKFKQPSFIKRALAAYFTNTKSEELLTSLSTNPNQQLSSSQQKSNAYFVMALFFLNSQQIARLLEKGHWPNTLPDPTGAVVQKMLGYFSSHSCNGDLAALAK